MDAFQLNWRKQAITLKTLRFGVIECAMQIFQHLQHGVQNG